MWTKDDDRLLRMYAEGGCSYADAAKVLKKTRGAVSGRAWRLGIRFHCDVPERCRAAAKAYWQRRKAEEARA